MPLLAAVVCLVLLAVPASAAAPAPAGLPAITGTARQGQQLTSTNGTFTGTAPIAYTRAWLRCDETGAACSPIAGASATTYTLAAADVGKTLRVVLTAANVDGEASATAPATAVVAPLAPPVNDPGGLPVISGTARDGQVLSATDGAWSGVAPITFTRLWQRCDAAGASCTSLAGAATQTLTSTDVGSTIRVQVTAKNADGQTVATSAQTAVVDSAAPAITVLPVVTGALRSGQTLSSTTGTWGGTVPIAYARQWTRCDVAGIVCLPIAGATGASYVLTDDDVGATIRVAVTATNVKASTTVSSATSATVGPSMPPLNTVAPSVTGTAVDGLILTAADGTWTGTAPIATSRRWQRCTALGADCVDLAGTATTLTLTNADVGSTIRTRVTATNADGSTQAVSAVTPVIGPAVPSATALPAISGSAREGQVLSATPGTWKGTPAITYAYAWQRCNPGCAPIAGATAATYRLAADDVGATLRVAVTATNDGGSTTASSAATATVTTGPPVNLDVPAVSGPLPRDGEQYSGTTGTWAGSAPIFYTYLWLRCNATGAACAPISGESTAAYRLASVDVGKTVRLEVTATNAAGSIKAQSAQSPVILPAPPAIATGPAIAGVLRDGQTLTADSTWSGTAPVALTYQWQRCDALAPTCADIAAATASTYRLASADVGSRMRVRIGALNAGGAGSATSVLALAGDPAGVVGPDAPHATAAATLNGTAVEGGTLTSSDGTFTGTTPLTRSYQWQRCDAAGNGCVDIVGATAADFVPTDTDRGSTLRVIVTASNAAGSDSTASAPSSVVAMAPPRNVVAPSVSPNTGLRDGLLLSSTDGGWTGSAPIAYAYRWERCTTTGTCTAVGGAAGPTYMLTAADVGFAMRLVVTAANGAGATSKASIVTGVVGTNPPVSVVPPTVTGTARDGEVLTAVDGVWTGPVIYTTSFEWWRCDTAGINCAIISGATGQSLVLSAADVGLTLRARVIRTSAGGQTGEFTAQTATIAAAPPQNTVAPHITGAAAVGKTLTAVPGTWAGTPPLDFAYQWRRCAVDGSACADIAGATGSTYTAVQADDAASLRVVVTVDNAIGSATATSPSTVEVQDDPPAVLTAPQILVPSGPVVVGATLIADPGAWGGAQPVSFEYQWKRCDAGATNCTAVAEATGGTYALTTADIDHRIVLTVTATNVVASTSVTTDATTAVLAEPPSNVALPVIAAAAGARDGATLVASPGTWNGATPLTYDTSWLRCEADWTGCGLVPGATGATYTLTADDVGHRIRARVTATNTTAAVSADTVATAVVLAAPPASVALPTVAVLAEKPLVGSHLSAQAGSWGGTAPLITDVRWQRCPATTLVCVDVAGAAGTDYLLTAADIGKRLRVFVTVSNVAGSAVASSAPTIVVPPIVPDTVVAPSISGTAREGSQLSGEAGSWTGTAPLAYTYQWERCTNPGDDRCTTISGATKATYTPGSADVGKYLRFAVSAANGGGKTTRPSAATEAVAAKPASSTPTTPKPTTTTTPAKTTTTPTTTKPTTGTKSTTTSKKSTTTTKKSTTTTTKKSTSTKKKTSTTSKKSTTSKRKSTSSKTKTSTKKKTTSSKKSTASKKTTAGTTTPIAAVARLRVTSSGRLRLSLRCPLSASRACGAVGTIIAGTSLGELVDGTSLTFKVRAATVRPGKTLVRTFKLTTAQLEELGTLGESINFRVRLAHSKAPTRVRERFVRTVVPDALAQDAAG